VTNPPLGPHHLAIQVRDLAASERFYSGLLGLRVVQRWPWDDGRPGERAVWLALGDMFIALEACAEPALDTDFRDSHAGLHLFAMRILPSQREAWERRLEGQIVHRSKWTLYVRDPDGNRIGLSHHPHDVGEGALVQRLRAQGIRDERVLAAFGHVPRAAFVPVEYRDLAEDDRPLDIGCGQTISQPYIVAVMTEALHLKPGQTVLEVGTGSGYQTALLASMGVHVVSIEIVPELLRKAADTLRSLGFTGIELRHGDGSRGVPDSAPFDAILVAAAPLTVPPALLEQLAPGGRMVIPVGQDLEHQELQLWTKDARTGALDRRVLAAVRFVPLVGGARHG
jgi:protein-L-isoaspartate(D-aspartate) O-methyltransferase